MYMPSMQKKSLPRRRGPGDKSSKLKHTVLHVKSSQKQQAVNAASEMLRCTACNVYCHAECIFGLNLSKVLTTAGIAQVA